MKSHSHIDLNFFELFAKVKVYTELVELPL